MITDKNLILHLPFDDPDGYNKVFDYSQSRKDGILSGGAFLTRHAKNGKALDINGGGECEVPLELPLNSDFTLCFNATTDSCRFGWLLNFPGIDNYLEKWIEVKPKAWVSFAFIKASNNLSVIADDKEVFNALLPASPVGFSFNDDFISGTYSCIDDLRLYDTAKTRAEILKIQSDSSDVEYYIDGNNFKEFGVYVSKSDGLIGLLDKKETLSVDWENYHGLVVNKKRPRFKERTITLDCFIEASGKSSFVEWVMLFLSKFQGEGTQRLKVEYDGKTRPLVYEVYSQNGSEVEKNWTYDNDLMVGTFRLNLVEYEPVKRILRHIGTTGDSLATITVTSAKLLNIYWGDGSHTFDISGTSKEINHIYEQPGEYDIVVTGVIEDIQDFDTNCIVIWDKLL